ncbi:MAG: Ppx/GppA phosphatase family protein [Neisseria sp.]|nr:Ppx/GppA phosphatase family protein [Neisseria sp.]
MKSNENIIASVDLGSNSFRLQIYHCHHEQWQIVDSIKEMVQLAAGLDAKKNLNKDVQERALACLARFGERLRGLKARQVRAVATNTFRVMNNLQPFLSKAEKALGFPIEIIAGREEARLIYTGVVHTVPFNQQRALIIDIGGGSTEFVIGAQEQPEITESLALGCVSYSMRFFAGDKVSASSFRNAVNSARSEIQRIAGGLKNISWDFAIGTSGSARAIRDVTMTTHPAEENIRYEHMQTLAKRITQAGGTRKARLEGLRPDRIEVFAGGLAVMMAAFEELAIADMTVTDAALRDGVFYDLIGRHLDQDMRDETIAQFQLRYHVDLAQAMRVEAVALRCLNGLAMQMSRQELRYWQTFVSWAARVHEIGLSIAHTGYHKHSAYILEQADMPGFSRKDQKVLATLVLGHRGDLKKMREALDNPLLCSAIICLRLAALFCRARADIVFPEQTSLQVNAAKKKCVLSISREWLNANPLSANALDFETFAWDKVGHQFIVKAL